MPVPLDPDRLYVPRYFFTLTVRGSGLIITNMIGWIILIVIVWFIARSFFVPFIYSNIRNEYSWRSVEHTPHKMGRKDLFSKNEKWRYILSSETAGGCGAMLLATMFALYPLVWIGLSYLLEWISPKYRIYITYERTALTIILYALVYYLDVLLLLNIHFETLYKQKDDQGNQRMTQEFISAAKDFEN
jgi:hypothetical protein